MLFTLLIVIQFHCSVTLNPELKSQDFNQKTVFPINFLKKKGDNNLIQKKLLTYNQYSTFNLSSLQNKSRDLYQIVVNENSSLKLTTKGKSETANKVSDENGNEQAYGTNLKKNKRESGKLETDNNAIVSEQARYIGSIDACGKKSNLMNEIRKLIKDDKLSKLGRTKKLNLYLSRCVELMSNTPGRWHLFQFCEHLLELNPHLIRSEDLDKFDERELARNRMILLFDIHCKPRLTDAKSLIEFLNKLKNRTNLKKIQIIKIIQLILANVLLRTDSSTHVQELLNETTAHLDTTVQNDVENEYKSNQLNLVILIDENTKFQFEYSDQLTNDQREQFWFKKFMILNFYLALQFVLSSNQLNLDNVTIYTHLDQFRSLNQNCCQRKF